ncbi:MAG: sensor histidine kinase [Dehalococcoidia bacterium]
MSSLQVRLLLSYLAVIGVTLGLAALTLFLLLGGYRDSISYGNLEDVGSLVSQQVSAELEAAHARNEDPSGPDLLLTVRAWLAGRPSDSVSNPTTTVLVVNRQGVVIGTPGTSQELAGAIVKDLQLPAGSASDDSRPRRCRLEAPERAPELCVSVPISTDVLAMFPGTEAVALVVAKPAAGLGEVLGDLLPRLAFAGLIGVAAALGLGFLLSQSVAAPLRNIARAARSVARGNYRQRVPATGPREVRDLAANFNRMTEDVQRSQQTLRDFLANISHELKTPLTSIRGFSQAMLDGTIDDKDGIDRSAKIISDESNRVLRLVEELLDLSRIESGQVAMRQEVIDLHELFSHVSEVFALRSEDNGVRLELAPDSTSAHVKGDFDRLEQVMNNLLDNAFRHTPAGGTVWVSSRRVQHGLVQVTVADTGRGIPPQDLPHLFERFYRANTGANGKGYGLGLAITREIVRAHGGDIWATSEPGKGTNFVFTLPAAVTTAAPAASGRRTPAAMVRLTSRQRPRPARPQ